MAHVGHELTLQAVGFEQLQVHAGKVIHSQIQFLIDRLQLDLGLRQVPKHAVEGFGEIRELIVGIDPEFDVLFAAGDLFAHQFELRERIDYQAF